MEILKPILMAGVDPLASPQTTLHRQVLALHGVVGRPPGTFAYSNANYDVLVDVIENVTGTSCARPTSVGTATPTGFRSTSWFAGSSKRRARWVGQTASRSRARSIRVTASRTIRRSSSVSSAVRYSTIHAILGRSWINHGVSRSSRPGNTRASWIVMHPSVVRILPPVQARL
jgi:CubicO group peptidase (beta-lactamase class C family)